MLLLEVDGHTEGATWSLPPLLDRFSDRDVEFWWSDADERRSSPDSLPPSPTTSTTRSSIKSVSRVIIHKRRRKTRFKQADAHSQVLSFSSMVPVSSVHLNTTQHIFFIKIKTILRKKDLILKTPDLEDLSAKGSETCAHSNVHRPVRRNWIPAAVGESDDDDLMTKFSGRSSTPMKTEQLYHIFRRNHE